MNLATSSSYWHSCPREQLDMGIESKLTFQKSCKHFLDILVQNWDLLIGIKLSLWNWVSVCWWSSNIILITALSCRSDLIMFTQSNSSENFLIPREYWFLCSSISSREALFRILAPSSAECGIKHVLVFVGELSPLSQLLRYLLY